MGRPRKDSIAILGGETTERLLAAAEAAFAASGLDGATLADIATRAGITRPALLYHFATKEDLYEAVIGRAFASLGEILRSAMAPGGDFPARLHAVIDGFLTYVSVHPALARLVVREVIGEGGPGRALVLAFGVPLLDEVVAFLEREGRGVLRDAIPVRAALMMVVSDVFLKSAAGDVRRALWGERDYAAAFADVLLLSR